MCAPVRCNWANETSLRLSRSSRAVLRTLRRRLFFSKEINHPRTQENLKEILSNSECRLFFVTLDATKLNFGRKCENRFNNVPETRKFIFNKLNELSILRFKLPSRKKDPPSI